MDDERKIRENKQHYEKWLSCGFTGEMVVDECGWCVMGNNLTGEEVTVFDKGYLNKAIVRFVQLPNKHWISGSEAFCRTHGHSWGLNIWNKQYNTKEEALDEALNRIEREIDEKDRKTLIKKVEEVRNRFKQDTLLLPVVTEHFEQVTLF